MWKLAPLSLPLRFTKCSAHTKNPVSYSLLLSTQKRIIGDIPIASPYYSIGPFDGNNDTDRALRGNLKTRFGPKKGENNDVWDK